MYFSTFYLGSSPYYLEKSEPAIPLSVDSTNRRKWTWDASPGGKVSDYSEKRDVTRSYRISRAFTYESNLGTICNIVLRQLPDLRFATYPSHPTSTRMTLVILIHESTHVYLTYSPGKESLLRNSYAVTYVILHSIVSIIEFKVWPICQLKKSFARHIISYST